MKIPKPPGDTKPVTIRLPQTLYDQLAADAATQAWSVNAEINHRLRAGPVLQQLRALTEEIADLKALILKLEKQRREP